MFKIEIVQSLIAIWSITADFHRELNSVKNLKCEIHVFFSNLHHFNT